MNIHKFHLNNLEDAHQNVPAEDMEMASRIEASGLDDYIVDG